MSPVLGRKSHGGRQREDLDVQVAHKFSDTTSVLEFSVGNQELKEIRSVTKKAQIGGP
jgi:hypothetical protein